MGNLNGEMGIQFAELGTFMPNSEQNLGAQGAFHRPKLRTVLLALYDEAVSGQLPSLVPREL